jgi:hypothetical protein
MATTMNDAGATKTRWIDGHKITLILGRRYLASRPIIQPGMKVFPVTITDITDGVVGAPVAAELGKLGYAAANSLLAAFNNGETSFEGRVW